MDRWIKPITYENFHFTCDIIQSYLKLCKNVESTREEGNLTWFHVSSTRENIQWHDCKNDISLVINVEFDMKKQIPSDHHVWKKRAIHWPFKTFKCPVGMVKWLTLKCANMGTCGIHMWRSKALVISCVVSCPHVQILIGTS